MSTPRREGICCNETGCTRKQPMMLMRSSFTGRFYITTDYVDLGNGRIEVETKHALSDQQQKEWGDFLDEADKRSTDMVDQLREELGLGKCSEQPDVLPQILWRDAFAKLRDLIGGGSSKRAQAEVPE